MDIQEIARLHTRYAEPPLTIEMPSSSSSTPALEAPGATPPKEAKAIWSRFSEVQRQAIGVLVVAAIAFPIGMWTASGGKRDSTTAASKTVATPPAAAAGASDVQSQEWPPREPMIDTAPHASPPAQQGSSAPATSPTPGASEAAAALVSTVPAPMPSNKNPIKAPAQTAPKSGATPSIESRVTSSAQTSHQADPRRSNDIKLF